MKTRIPILTGLLLAASAPFAFAQLPIISVNMTEIDVISGPGPTYYAIYGNNPDFGNLVPLNGGNGPYTDAVNMWALATGTFPEGGYTYTFYVSGQKLASAINNPSGGASDGIAQAVGWTPPEPGVYYFSCVADDGLGHSAVSLAVEYYATGISIVSPVRNSIVPLLEANSHWN